jgi:hypothetical protein
MKLSFQQGNSKLGKNIFTFSIPSGYSCPFAKECLSKADRTTGKITDGPDTQFRCFSASQEMLYPNVRKSRWANFESVKQLLTDGNLVESIVNSIPVKATIVRIHVAGDFFNQAYFDAWVAVARQMPHVVFYAYTKSIRYWVNRLNDIPANMKLNASLGGKDDDLIAQYNLKSVKVVYSLEEAGLLKIDHDDTLAFTQDQSFALLIHGKQAKQSKASLAISALRKIGITGYSSKNKRIPVAV